MNEYLEPKCAVLYIQSWEYKNQDWLSQGVYIEGRHKHLLQGMTMGIHFLFGI